MEVKIEVKGIKAVEIGLGDRNRSKATKEAFLISNRKVLRMLRDYIWTEGEGTWPKHHQITEIYRKDENDIWHERRKPRKGFDWMNKHLYNTPNISTLKSRFHLDDIAEHVSRGYRTSVTPKMRRKLAIIGHPISNTTTQLVSPRRPLMRPVWNRARKMLPKLCADIYMSRTEGKDEEIHAG